MAFANGQELQADHEVASFAGLPAKRRQLLLGATICFCIVAAAIGLRWYFDGENAISTDDAYVGASLAEITSQIDGTITQVLVSDTQRVRRGDLLVTLDSDDTNLEVEQARAAYQQAVQHVQQYLAKSNEASADVEGKVAALSHAKLALDRRILASASGAISAEELSNARSAYSEARTDLTMAQQRLVSQRAMIGNADIRTNPEIMSAQAALDAALLNLKRTKIRAPVDGVVAQSRAQIGERIRVGATLMSIVPIMDVFVDANFKEGEIEHIRPGQPASLTSDLYGSGVVFHGRIEGIGGGTGAALAVIPAQNATGNWIKVVQRLPVRIALDPPELERHQLRAGLSMNVTVDLRDSQNTMAATPPIRSADASQPY